MKTISMVPIMNPIGVSTSVLKMRRRIAVSTTDQRMDTVSDTGTLSLVRANRVPRADARYGTRVMARIGPRIGNSTTIDIEAMSPPVTREALTKEGPGSIDVPSGVISFPLAMSGPMAITHLCYTTHLIPPRLIKSFRLEVPSLGNIRRIVLDVLKPHKPDLVQYSERLSSVRDVKGVSIFLNEVDQETESVKIIVEGQRLNYEVIRRVIEEMAGSIHSIDAIYAGEELIDEVETPQDR
jgi:hypothetical protein